MNGLVFIYLWYTSNSVGEFRVTVMTMRIWTETFDFFENVKPMTWLRTKTLTLDPRIPNRLE